MPIGVECESCGKKLKVKDESAGRRIKCPDCGDPIKVPGGKPRKKAARRKQAEEEDEGETDYSSLDFGQLAKLERRSESLGQGTIEKCPSCGEPVGAKALECPHCFEPIQEIKQMERTRQRLKKDAKKPVILKERELSDRQLKAAAKRRGKTGMGPAQLVVAVIVFLAAAGGVGYFVFQQMNGDGGGGSGSSSSSSESSESDSSDSESSESGSE